MILRRLQPLVAAGMILAACPTMAAAPPSSADPLSRMFAWWDGAFTRPGSFTQAAFERFFTRDATLELNGKVVIHGIAEWAPYFQAIQARGGVVEIVLPFKAVFRSGDRLYTYHVIRSRRNGGVAGCMLASGYAVIRGGKIASLMLVRHALDPKTDQLDPACWAS